MKSLRSSVNNHIEIDLFFNLFIHPTKYAYLAPFWYKHFLYQTIVFFNRPATREKETGQVPPPEIKNFQKQVTVIFSPLS